MKVFYSRISTNDGSQTDERQLQNIKEFDYVLSDKCSGTIPLWERPKGGQIKKLIDDNQLKESYFMLKLGLSLNDIWFIKRKYN